MHSIPDAILVCGGAGTRLRSVTGDLPKAMAEIAGRPFLELLLRQLRRHGFKRAILAVGYQKDAICSHFGEEAFGLQLAYSIESSPLGTGGAVRKASDLLDSDSALVMNGDSYTDANLREFVSDYRGSEADASMIVVPADGRSDCGSPKLDRKGRIVSFDEKAGVFHSPYLNAGIYLLSRTLLRQVPPDLNISLERELLPSWLHQGRYIKGFVSFSRCIDIGTPERYRDAQDTLAHIEEAVTLSE